MSNEDKISIALVDDHQIYLDGLSSMLIAQANFKIVFVETSPIIALEKLKNKIPDIIITDMSMPEMSGVEFVKIIKKQYPQIKILVLSMHQYKEKFEDIDGYLVKETNKKILIEAINEMVLINKKYNIPNIKNTANFNFNKNILSPREKEIIRLISEQYTAEQIAIQLSISKTTIATHKKNIFVKLKVNSIAGLIKEAIYLGVIK
ncbi:response regulator [Flavobacterium sp.]|uniref:response regulator n=1 Tax=Flavobacterium sp. TaxID=239 RepID=UPI0037526B3B